MTELYTNMRYLQGAKLDEMNLRTFDAWASTFGETQTAMELAPEGTGYRTKTRFSKFYNLPELVNVFKEAADIKTSETLELDVPEAEYEDVVVERSEYQAKMLEHFSERADKVRGGMVDPSVDNMLKITNDGRLMALDQRLVNPMLPDDPNSKVNKCVEISFDIWDKTKKERSTQIIFCDLSTPNKDGRFNIYDDIKNKLIAKGVPEKEIAFIHDANTETQKASLFAKVRSGEVRFILGSTPKLGAGTNIQTKLLALHHLDVPWRPSDIEQQEGRIIRQGNHNDKVKIYRYITKDTFDAFSWQTIENKQKFIGQIMTSKSPVRMADDIDELSFNYAEVKALCVGNPLIKEKMELDVEVNKLKMLKSSYKSEIFRLQDDIAKNIPRRIAANKERIAALKIDKEFYDSNRPKTEQSLFAAGDGKERKDEPFLMEIFGKSYDNKEDAGKAIIDACRSMELADDSVDIGKYLGFKMGLYFSPDKSLFFLELKHTESYNIVLGDSALGNIARINNCLDKIGDELVEAKKRLECAENELETAKREVQKPFAKEEEYMEKSARLLEVNRLLENLDPVQGKEHKLTLNKAEYTTRIANRSEKQGSQGQGTKKEIKKKIAVGDKKKVGGKKK